MQLLRGRRLTSADQSDFTKRLAGLNANILPTLLFLFRRASLHTTNTSSIPTLLRQIALSQGRSKSNHSRREGPHEVRQQDSVSGITPPDNFSLETISRTDRTAEDACAVLTFISKHLPSLYTRHIAALLSGASGHSSHDRVVEICLQALAAAARSGCEIPSLDAKVEEQIKERALGNNARHAKVAARFLAFQREDMCREVVQVRKHTA